MIWEHISLSRPTLIHKQVCNVCNEVFENKTKLFAHVRDTGHAAAESTPAPVPTKGSSSKQPKTKKGKR
jgi:DnaJ family protein A protein 5